MADLYQILGVPRDASQDDIKRAYRRRARESHPDAGGDEETFKQVTHAYQVLSDPDARARYDRFGDDGTPRTRGAGADPFGFGGGFGGIGDVIDAFFGTGFARERSGTTRVDHGRDVLVPIEITLEDVATGTRRPVEVDVAGICDSCGGSGSRSGGGAVTCSTCGGAGQVQRVVRTAFGQLATASGCPSCGGTGRAVRDPCPTCDGEGRRRKTRRVTVEIPAGVEIGDRLRVAGAGEAGRTGGAAGDLYVEVHVADHEVFERRGRDLFAEIHVPFTQAVLGSSLEVPTIDGATQSVTVPPGTQPGDVLRVRKAGLPAKGGGAKGDLHLAVAVDIPTDLDTEQRELVERLAELRGEDAGGGGRGLFTRLREAFR